MKFTLYCGVIKLNCFCLISTTVLILSNFGGRGLGMLNIAAVKLEPKFISAIKCCAYALLVIEVPFLK